MFERFTERARKVVVLAQEERGGSGTIMSARNTCCWGSCVVVRRLADGEPDPDPFDEVERSNEGGEERRLLFRGRVSGIRAELALPRSVAVSVDADYAYLTPGESADGSTTVEPGDVAALMRTGLQEADSPRLEAVIKTLGERLLHTFPAMLEVSVSVSGAPEPAEPPAPTFSVSATFRR